MSNVQVAIQRSMALLREMKKTDLSDANQARVHDILATLRAVDSRQSRQPDHWQQQPKDWR